MRWDHPRVCGKNALSGWLIRDQPGSPPRVREKLNKDCCSFFFNGITPACAGKTRLFAISKTLSRDHPRVCGKNVGMTYDMVASQGSPPRVREKQPFGKLRHLNARITPACAGKTSISLDGHPTAQDHPRVCGKNSASTGSIPLRLGSPPRVREKH